MTTYHVDGRLVPAEEASVDVRDRGFTYGDGVFETLRAYGGEPFEWAAHVDRLQRSAARLDFDEALPPPDDLHDRVTETLAANDLADAAVRVSITRGVQSGTLTPDPRVDPTIVVVAEALPRGGTDGARVWDDPATLRTVETRRPPEVCLPPGAKTNSYLPAVLSRLELDGADEALVRSLEGHVVGGAASTLFFVREGTLYTPTTQLPVLPGITRGVVLDVARGESFPVETGRYTVDDVRGADEVFLTSTTWEVRPVSEVDDRLLGIGPITRLCQRLFDERVERAHY